MNDAYLAGLEGKLVALGLLPKEAKIYLTLLGAGEISMALLATRAGLKRPTTYEICNRLVQRGLITIYEHNKKQMVQPQSPESLRGLARTHEEIAQKTRQEMENEIETLKKEYDSARLRPTIRFATGEEAVAESQSDVLEVGETLYLVRTKADKTNPEAIGKFIKQRIKKGIKVLAVTPDAPDANRDPKKDEAGLFERKWIDAESYQSPVQIQSYGNRVSFINYGQREMGLIIEDADIAQAIREMIVALRNKLK